MRWVLAEMGYEFRVSKRDVAVRDPVIGVHRHRNGFYFSGYCPNTTATLRLRFPQGAPVLLGYETELVHGYTTYRLPRSWHQECRVFVGQEADSILSCTEYCAEERRGISRRFLVRGLNDATVRFYPEPGKPVTAFLKTPDPTTGDTPFNVRLPVRHDRDASGEHVYLEGFTGDLMFGW